MLIVVQSSQHVINRYDTRTNFHDLHIDFGKLLLQILRHLIHSSQCRYSGMHFHKPRTSFSRPLNGRASLDVEALQSRMVFDNGLYLRLNESLWTQVEGLDRVEEHKCLSD